METHKTLSRITVRNEHLIIESDGDEKVGKLFKKSHPCSYKHDFEIEKINIVVADKNTLKIYVADYDQPFEFEIKNTDISKTQKILAVLVHTFVGRHQFRSIAAIVGTDTPINTVIYINAKTFVTSSVIQRSDSEDLDAWFSNTHTSYTVTVTKFIEDYRDTLIEMDTVQVCELKHK